MCSAVSLARLHWLLTGCLLTAARKAVDDLKVLGMTIWADDVIVELYR